MALRPPSAYSASSRSVLDPLDHEIAGEKAAALGRAGDKAARALASLRALRPQAPERAAVLREAARAVHAYFIQRELCGLRRHDDAIREYAIPPAVLARLGAE